MSKDKESEPKPEEELFASVHQAEKNTDAPLIRVMALHALAYCERLFYLEEVEEIRVADANVYAGRRMHAEQEKAHDMLAPAGLELSSEQLGIRGKIDWLKREDGHLVVYEYKKGSSQKDCAPWPSDRLQALAYALLLAESKNEDVPEVRIRYFADNQLIRVPVDAQAKKDVAAAVARARKLRESTRRPPVNVAEKCCRTCSLAPVCLPEEARFANQEKTKVARFFPADDDRRIVHVVEPGSRVSRDGEQIVITMPDQAAKRLPGHGVRSILLHGNVQISSQCLHFCAAHDITVHWLSGGGRYIAAMASGPGGVQRRIRQYQALTDTVMCARLSGVLCRAKVENQLRYLLRISRGEERSVAMSQGLDVLRGVLRQIADLCDILEKQPDPEDVAGIIATLRGFEGTAARHYFQLLPFAMKLQEKDLLFFAKRTRRPPRDPFNALLSFGYALVYKECLAALLAVGLEPAFGFMHTPRSSAQPLVLDLMDLFRVLLWDMPLIGSVGRKQWKESDFKRTKALVWLNEQGRRKAIQLFEARKREKWKHPVLQYSLSYARTVELEARLLEKEWSGESGLFAQVRLR